MTIPGKPIPEGGYIVALQNGKKIALAQRRHRVIQAKIAGRSEAEIAEQEGVAQNEMRLSGATEQTIADVAGRWRSYGRRIVADPATNRLDRSLKWIERVSDFCKGFSFRLRVFRPEIGGLGVLNIRIINDDGIFWLDTRHVTKEARILFVKSAALQSPSNVGGEDYQWYPCLELMNAVQWLLATSGGDDVLSEDLEIDQEAFNLLGEVLDSAEYKLAGDRIRQENALPPMPVSPTSTTHAFWLRRWWSVTRYSRWRRWLRWFCSQW